VLKWIKASARWCRIRVINIFSAKMRATMPASLFNLPDMKIKFFLLSMLAYGVAVQAFGQQQKPGTIDRKSLVRRHNLRIIDTGEMGPTQVGNGNFAYGFDITGMQSLSDKFTTMSQWSWHSTPPPEGMTAADFKKTDVESYGRKVPYDLPNPQQSQLTRWLSMNPHRFNLGRIGLWAKKAEGGELTASDIKLPVQTLDLWTGTAVSIFSYKGSIVRVITVADPDADIVSFRIESALLKKGEIGVFIDFPYANLGYFSNASDYTKSAAHQTYFRSAGSGNGTFYRTMDGTRYSVSVRSSGGRVEKEQEHRYRFVTGSSGVAEYSFRFSSKSMASEVASADAVKLHAAAYWPRFWRSGAAIDFSRSKDPRWMELERRVVLSQYLMKINASGNYPPQETGLVSNSWYGRFHYEMIWWHNAHYALWDRWPLFNNSLHVYRDNLVKARERARLQGYQGARFSKCTGPDGREWPDITHAFLVWQQPHPIFFAALDYRAHPNKQTLKKWSDIVDASADFLASFAHYDSLSKKYELGPPIASVPENNNVYRDKNPAFELGYWRFALRTANWFRQKQGLAPKKNWQDVYNGLAPIPVKDGVYEQWEGITDMWTKFNFEHPALLGVFGMLPGDGVDQPTMDRTFAKVQRTWKFNTGWGWDFPMAAMTAARLGKPGNAVEMLLYDTPKNGFDRHGLVGGGNPYPYFPTNGGLLYAVAMMTAGWDGDHQKPEPGFPKDGSWVVRWEDLKKAP
jgi:hypothetical protein